MFVFGSAGSRRYVWKPFVDFCQLVGAAMLKPAVSLAAAGCEVVVNPLGSGPVAGLLIASMICSVAGGSVAADDPDVGPEDEPVPVAWPCGEILVQEHDGGGPGRRADDRQRHDGGLPAETGPPWPGRRVPGAGPGRRTLRLLWRLPRPARWPVVGRRRVARAGAALAAR